MVRVGPKALANQSNPVLGRMPMHREFNRFDKRPKARLLLEGSGDGGEDCIQVGTGQPDCGDDHHRDQERDQPVLDRRHALFVAGELLRCLDETTDVKAPCESPPLVAAYQAVEGDGALAFPHVPPGSDRVICVLHGRSSARH